jgi:ABC-type transporter Mla maintaining outer membrane lipid asymmetry ATPase subunit MlaF/ABC-type transporter Mla maintaining outer membrane lipid asymmetry permease subunit MlaE
MTNSSETATAGNEPNVAAPDRLSPRPLRLIDLHIEVADQVLLSDTSLTFPAGKITVIVGGSGAGKSVLLKTLAGLIPQEGEAITWAGTIELAEEHDRPRVGIVFQQFALFDELSPAANVQFAIDHRSDAARKPAQSATEWLTELGVPAKVAVANLSGGQKQRLAIARTLAADPDIVLYDEPTSGLDSASGRKVADLIRATHLAHRRTSIIVTHDYETLLPIADEVLLLDSSEKRLLVVPRDEWVEIAERMRPVAARGTSEPPSSTGLLTRRVADFFSATGSVVIAALRLPMDLLPIFPRPRWGLRFLLHYLRLVGGPSAWVYLVVAGLIVGFTTTYFTFRFLPFRMYTQPLLIDELLASIGFALYRFLVPVLATVLIAARCGAAVAADVGVKQYGGQVDALRTLGVKPRAYLLVPIVLAFVIATPVLQWLAFTAAHLISLVTFNETHGSIGPYFWQQHFFRNLRVDDSVFLSGWRWVTLKNVLCGVGTATIGYYRGIATKESASDVSNAITSTVLWTTLYVLVVHFVVALIEF